MSMMIHRAVLRQRAAEEKAKAEPMPSPAVEEQPENKNVTEVEDRPARRKQKR